MVLTLLGRLPRCLPPSLPPTFLLFESELIGEAGEEAERFGSSRPSSSLATGPLLPISAGQLQLNGHQNSALLRPTSPNPVCLPDYGLLLLLLLGLGLRHRLANGLEQPVGEPAPAPPRILFLILA